ncbi:MAG: endonuclease/exonuclease/phosphatase family protein [Oscillospiraceae bacterium]|nr:endonuclease/exonuclease/phosphatase family protein [Oscillospiraceae bacterium]
MQTINVATWNIGSLYQNYEKNIRYLERMISGQQIDILCMQELPRIPELLESICRWGGFGNHLFQVTSESHVCRENDMGIAIFSRFPLVALETVRLTKPTVPIFYKGREEFWHDKYFLAASCDFGEKKGIVVTGHGFPFHRYEMENEENYHIIRPPFEELDAWLGQLESRFSLDMFCVSADLNYPTPLQFMPDAARRFTDVFAGQATRPTGRKTDTVLIPEGVSAPEMINIPCQEDGETVFDHYFIMAGLQR